MLRLKIAYGTPFVAVTLIANGLKLTLSNVMVDTGSAATLIKTDELAKLNLHPENKDPIQFLAGVGGIEGVIPKQVDSIQAGELRLGPFTVYIGGLDYHIPMDGVIGLDFLIQTGAQINLKSLTLGKE